MRKFNKDGQITIFFIIGIVLLLTLLLFVYYSSSIKQKKVALVDTNTERNSIEHYVTQCIVQVAKPLISEISNRGGSFAPASGIFWNNKEINALAVYKTGIGYENQLLLRQSIETELSEMIKHNLKTCVDMSIFKNKGYNITEKEHSVKSIINDKAVIVNLKYPLEVTIGTAKLNFEDFSASIDSSLGRLYDAAVDIVNIEVQDGYFDKEDFMLKNGAAIRVEKHKPYPDIVYVLKSYEAKSFKDLIFQFAIKGKDITGKEVLRYNNKFGCCTNNIDSTCFKNVQPAKCGDNTYNSDVNCECSSNLKTDAEGCCVLGINDGNCELISESQCSSKNGKFYKDDFRCAKAKCSKWDCKSTYNYVNDDFSGPLKKHGESWCSYESIVGKGFDYVGTRHYLHSCVQGTEYVEECRDFREEFCAEGVIGVYDEFYSKGLCRINRWYDCSEQKNESSCRDELQRDCYWFGALYSQLKCHPEVPPGLKFWEGDNSICNVASLDKDQDGMDYPRSWGHSTLLYCQRTGDCGNYRNYDDEITTFGYYNKDGTPESWVYLENGNTQRGNEFVVGLSLYLNFLSDAAKIPRGPNGNYAQCNLWQSPLSGNCDLCHNSKLHPCTEYRCKSLGRNCNFRHSDKKCINQKAEEKSLPEIKLDSSTLKFTIQNSTYYKDATEYIIEEPILIHEPFTFQFETTKPTRCKISLYPPTVNPETASDSTTLPEIFLNDDEFKQEYSVTLRFPSSSFTKMDTYKLFIRCTDEDGLNNKETILVVKTYELVDDIIPPEILGINHSNNDFVVIVNEPFNDCKASFNETDYESMSSLNCSTEEKDIVYNVDYPLGSYLCDATIFVPQESQKINFICEDKHGNRNLVFVYSIK